MTDYLTHATFVETLFDRCDVFCHFGAAIAKPTKCRLQKVFSTCNCTINCQHFNASVLSTLVCKLYFFWELGSDLESNSASYFSNPLSNGWACPSGWKSESVHKERWEKFVRSLSICAGRVRYDQWSHQKSVSDKPQRPRNQNTTEYRLERFFKWARKGETLHKHTFCPWAP